MIPWLAVGLMVAARLDAAPKERGWNWRETTSPHFMVEHEMPWTPPGFVMSLERMHSRLRMDLGMFSPWMAKERVKLYLYRGKEGYQRGQFHPPEWSNGIADYKRRLIVSYELESGQKLMQVVAHEMTHLIFFEYMGRANENQRWINEGLAVYEESKAGQPASGGVAPPQPPWPFGWQPMSMESMITMVPASEKGVPAIRARIPSAMARASGRIIPRLASSKRLRLENDGVRSLTR